MSLWLTLHLIGVVVFVGNIVTAAFWKVRADLSNKPEHIAAAVRNVMLADYVFTLPGLALIMASGIVMAVTADWPMSGLNWLTLSLILFAVTGIVWLAVLIPLQRSMIRCSQSDCEAGSVSRAYRLVSRRWAVFGIVATLLPVIIMYLMVTRSF